MVQPKRKSTGKGNAPEAKKQKLQKKDPKPETPAKSKKVNQSSQRKAPAAATGGASSSSQFNLSRNLTEQTWVEKIGHLFQTPYFQAIQQHLNEELENGAQVFPPQDQVFRAFNMTPFDQVKVVILGQDPYHDDGQAEGLSFSVPNGEKIPPSLRNIYKEIEQEYPGFQPPSHGHLGGWAQQGVLLLNATLTVRAHEPNSHAKFGWQKFTDDVIKILVKDSSSGVVFLLWGGFAHKKEKLITSPHIAIKTAHPSPLSFNKFKDCGCFKDVNAKLVKLKRKPIDWTAL